MDQDARDVRWWILHTVEMNYPREVSERTISLALDGIKFSLTPGQLGVQLAYLEEKGYVARSVARSQRLGEERALVRLTAKGKDLLEGNIDRDPGIDSSGPDDSEGGK